MVQMLMKLGNTRTHPELLIEVSNMLDKQNPQVSLVYD